MQLFPSAPQASPSHNKTNIPSKKTDTLDGDASLPRVWAQREVVHTCILPPDLAELQDVDDGLEEPHAHSAAFPRAARRQSSAAAAPPVAVLGAKIASVSPRRRAHLRVIVHEPPET